MYCCTIFPVDAFKDLQGPTLLMYYWAVRKPKDLFFLFLITPIVVVTPIGQEKPNLQASPSGLIKQDLNFKVEGYVKPDFDQEFQIKEKIPGPSVELKIEGLIPAPLEEVDNGTNMEQSKPRGLAPSVAEIKINGSSAAISMSRAGEPESATEPTEAKTEQIIDFLNECHFSGPEPSSLKIKDLPSSRYELSPVFSLSSEGMLLAKTGDYLTYISAPVSIRAGLEGEIAGDAAIRNLEGKGLILPYQAIELAQKRVNLIRNITRVELTKHGNNPSVYRVQSFEKLKLLGLITFETGIETTIDAATGKTLKQHWLSKLPSLLITHIT